MESAGLLLQMDGSTHRWFGDKKSCLIAMIDDATSDLHAQFFKSETTHGCLKVMRDYIDKNGLFKTLYVDKAGIFGGPKQCNFSQVQRACEELGIEIIFANSPQGKGRIERAFDTLQDRLIPELRLNHIIDIHSANRYLQDVFLPDYWRKNLPVNAKNSATELVPIPRHLELDDICIQKDYRKIRNDHTFSYGNKFYLIDEPLKRSITKQKIEIRKLSDGSFNAYFSGCHLTISEVVEPTKPSIYEPEIQKKIDAIELAEKLENVTEAARLYKNRTSKDIEQTVIQFSLENPYLGQAQVSAHLKASFNIELSPGGVREIWVREKMNTCTMRLRKSNSLNIVARLSHLKILS